MLFYLNEEDVFWIITGRFTKLQKVPEKCPFMRTPIGPFKWYLNIINFYVTISYQTYLFIYVRLQWSYVCTPSLVFVVQWFSDSFSDCTHSFTFFIDRGVPWAEWSWWVRSPHLSYWSYVPFLKKKKKRRHYSPDLRSARNKR